MEDMAWSRHHQFQPVARVSSKEQMCLSSASRLVSSAIATQRMRRSVTRIGAPRAFHVSPLFARGNSSASFGGIKALVLRTPSGD